SPLASMLPTLEGEPPDPRTHPPGCPFAPRCPLAEPACDAALPEPEPAPTHEGLVACLHAGESTGARLQVREAGGPGGDPGRAATSPGHPGAQPLAKPGPALLLTDVTKAFGRGDRRRVVVDGLCLEVPAGVATRRPRELSGGQRQRVALARAVAVPPALLACDEPISALDVSLAATVLNLLTNLRAELGMAMLFVTHDLAAARFIGDRVAVMAGGRIVEEAGSEDILTNPQHPHTAALVAAIPTF